MAEQCSLCKEEVVQVVHNGSGLCYSCRESLDLDPSRPTADQLNEHLRSDGVVQVTTYTRSVLYRKRHTGMFAERDGQLHVQRGRQWDCLSTRLGLLCGVRLGRMV